MTAGRILSATGVQKTFGGVRALDGVDLDVDAGGVTALIGPNGAGKSTLFNVLSGLERPDAGQVALAGRAITGMAAERIAALGLGRSFQTPRPFTSLTAVENVMVGSHATTRSGWLASLLNLPAARAEARRVRQAALDWLAFVGLAGVADEPVDRLPFGARRNVEIARILAASPRLLCLDEPAAGLNATEVVALAALIRKIVGAGISVLLVEHRMELVMSLSTRIAVLQFGRKIADGTPAEIRADQAVIAAYLGAHARRA